MAPRVLIFLPRVVVLVVAMAVISDQCEAHIFTLERVNDTGVDLMRRRDGIRHGRLLQQQQQQATGVVDFNLQGASSPSLAGLYYTRVHLGTPPQEYHVQIDTGSNIFWVNCNHCSGCPTFTTLNITLHSFDPTTSSTSSMISCSDQRCALGAKSSGLDCIDHNQCGYTITYADTSATSGYLVSDTLVLDSIIGKSLTANRSPPVVFGCSTSQAESVLASVNHVDGLVGLGHSGMSLISQLALKGITPYVFFHCLKGDGGGLLVLGRAVEPNIVYTPLIPSTPYYSVDLQSISINGQTLPVSSSAFNSDNNGAIIDSGTTLAYFTEEAYDAFFTVFTHAISPSVRSTFSNGFQCYVTSSSVTESFPTVNLHFRDGASMTLTPQDYLFQQIISGSIWCLGFQTAPGQKLTILGDLVLKDKIVVYDLAAKRIGWVNYNCSSAVNVSTSNPGRTGNNSATRYELYYLILSAITAFLFHIAL